MNIRERRNLLGKLFKVSDKTSELKIANHKTTESFIIYMFFTNLFYNILPLLVFRVIQNTLRICFALTSKQELSGICRELEVYPNCVLFWKQKKALVQPVYFCWPEFYVYKTYRVVINIDNLNFHVHFK